MGNTQAATAKTPARSDDYERIEREYGNPKRTIALIMVAAVGMYLMCMALATCLSLRIAAFAPDAKNDYYSTITAIGSFLILFAVPLQGALSDRTTSRWGRRKPWILGCLVVSLVSCALVGLINNIVAIGVFYVIAQVSMQCAFSTYSVIPVEGVPDCYRGRVMGFMGMFGALATSAGSYIAGALVTMPVVLMITPVAAALITTLPLLFLYRDPAKRKEDVSSLELKEVFGSMLVNPAQNKNYFFVWVTRLLTGFTIAALFSYFTYYLIDVMQVPLTNIGTVAGTLTLMSAPVSIIFFTCSGWISDKIGRRKPLVVASGLCMAASLIIAGTSHSFVQFAIGWLVFAMGQAMYLTADLALCAAVLPDKKDAGKDMGMFQVALSIGQMLAPVLAPFVLRVGQVTTPNYLLFWAVAAVAALVAAAMMPLVKGVK